MMARRGGSRRRAVWCVVAALVLAGCATGGPHFETGQRFAAERKWDEAIAAYEQALREEPGNAQYTAALKQVRASAAEEERVRAEVAAGAQRQLRDFDRGLAAIEKALRYDPQHAPSLALQARLRERRTALMSEISTLLQQGRAAGQRGEWEVAERNAAQILAIDPANADALALKGDAARGAVQKGLRLAEEAELKEDWRRARFLYEGLLAREPGNETILARLKAARERDNAEYYITRAREMEDQDQIHKAYLYLKAAAKYYQNEVQGSLDRLALEGRRRAYTEALKVAENAVWGRVYVALADAVQTFGPAPAVDSSLQKLVKELNTKLTAYVIDFEEKHLGTSHEWLRTILEIDAKDAGTANKIEEARKKLGERVRVKIAPFEFDSPKAAPDAGGILSGAIGAELHKLKQQRKDVEVVERSQLASVIKERGMIQTGVVSEDAAKDFRKLKGVDYVLVGNVLKYGTEQNDDQETKTRPVTTGFKEEDNAAFYAWAALPEEARKRIPQPSAKIRTPITQLYTYRAGTVKATAFAGVSFRLLSTETGEIVLNEKVERPPVLFSRDYSEGLEGHVPSKKKEAPDLNGMLKTVTDQTVGEIVGRITRHFENRAEKFLKEGQELQRRRQVLDAIEAYVNSITAAELEGTGAHAATAARAQIEKLLRY